MLACMNWTADEILVSKNKNKVYNETTNKTEEQVELIMKKAKAREFFGALEIGQSQISGLQVEKLLSYDTRTSLISFVFDRYITGDPGVEARSGSLNRNKNKSMSTLYSQVIMVQPRNLDIF